MLTEAASSKAQVKEEEQNKKKETDIIWHRTEVGKNIRKRCIR